MKAEFSEKIRKLRKDKGISQTMLAKRLSVNKSIISAYENQERLPSLAMLVKLSYCFNVSMEYLLGINRNNTIDVSGLTPEQILAVNSVSSVSISTSLLLFGAEAGI